MGLVIRDARQPGKLFDLSLRAGRILSLPATGLCPTIRLAR